MRSYLFVIGILLGLLSCSNYTPELREGTLYYKVTYLDSSVDKPIIEVLPRNISVTFKNNSTATHIQGFLGLFTLTMIKQDGNPETITLLRVLDKKYKYVSADNDQYFGYTASCDYAVRRVNETKEIAGFVCNKAIASCAENNFQPVVVYYTYEVGIDSPNVSNPFRDIDGVLMEFQVQFQDINMRMEAEKVNLEKIDDAVFQNPADYESVSYDRMRELINMFN